MTYDSAAIYIDAATDLADKIGRMNQVIAALETSALKAAESSDISEYQLDDGQTRIRTTYRSPADVAKAITAYETIRQRYINQLNGRAVRLVDSKNFIRQ